MTWQSISPELLGGIQPFSGNLTLVTTIATGANAFTTVFISNSDAYDFDYVRLAVKPSNETLDDKHYILYDTPLHPRSHLPIPNIALGSQDQILVRSRNGYAIFNITGDRIINNS